MSLPTEKDYLIHKIYMVDIFVCNVSVGQYSCLSYEYNMHIWVNTEKCRYSRKYFQS